jgi:hypothetical protein
VNIYLLEGEPKITRGTWGIWSWSLGDADPYNSGLGGSLGGGRHGLVLCKQRYASLKYALKKLLGVNWHYKQTHTLFSSIFYLFIYIYFLWVSSLPKLFKYLPFKLFPNHKYKHTLIIILILRTF